MTSLSNRTWIYFAQQERLATTRKAQSYQEATTIKHTSTAPHSIKVLATAIKFPEMKELPIPPNRVTTTGTQKKDSHKKRLTRQL